MTSAFYESLCQSLSFQPVTKLPDLTVFNDLSSLSEASKGEVLAAALSAVLELMTDNGDQGRVIDRDLIDRYIVKINEMMNGVLDAILHDPVFQSLEATWRGLEYLLQYAPHHKNIKIDILNASKSALISDFEQSTDVIHSGLYEHVYKQEYDTPGGEPFAAMIADYDIGHGHEDLTLLKAISKVASFAQCPFIAAASSGFFQKSHIGDIMMMEEVGSYLERAEYIAWQRFREAEESRYIGLTLPKFMLRMPYGAEMAAKADPYSEVCDEHEDFLWGNAAFAFGVNMLKSFVESGWAVNIRGAESGGKVPNLPLYHYNVGRGLQTKIPTETIIPESRELELANLGFIPLCYYKNSDFACFFSANSIQKPRLYLDAADTANSRINARLPYIFLSSRIAHYLKVLQRENIGASKSAAVLKQELNKWLQTLVTTMPNPGLDLIATHPLSQAYVEVKELEDNPGFYRVELFMSPHFQIEGVNVLLSLVARMPGVKLSS